MQYSRANNNWSYNSNNNVPIVKVYNNNGENRVLKSITVNLGTGKGSITNPYPGSQKVSGSGAAITLHLTSSYGDSNSVTVTNVCYRVTGSSGKQNFNTSSTTAYTFTFSDRIVIGSGVTVTFSYDKSGGVLVCPHDDKIGVSGWDEADYSEPSNYYINADPAIGICDQTTFGGNYRVTRGNGAKIYWIDGGVFNDVTWSYGQDPNDKLSSQRRLWAHIHDATDAQDVSGRWTFTSPNNDNRFADGAKYKLAIRFSDGRYVWLSGDDKSFYTYKKPSITNAKVDAATISPQNNKKVTWTANSRCWTAYESNFTTRFTHKVNNSLTNQVTSVSQAPSTNNNYSTTANCEATLDNALINSLFTASERSTEVLKAKFNILRKNPSAKRSTAGDVNYEFGQEVSVNIQYQPSKSPNNFTVQDSNGNSVANQIIYVQDIPEINLNWQYPYSALASGVVNGYICQVFIDADCTTKYGEDINITSLGNEWSASLTLNTKTKLKRGVTNYIKITPYYTRPDGNGNILGTSSLVTSLVLPISRLNTPTIDYPISNTTWHNNKFRILFKLPEDDDLQELINQKVIANKEAYRYDNIEVMITTSNNVTYTYKSNSSIFSAKTLGYNRSIVVNPSLITNFPDTTYYSIKVRVAKKYWITNETKIWSDWSNIVNINIQSVNNIKINKEDKVLADHYKYIQQASIRLNKVYPISSIPSNNVYKDKGDIIKHIYYNDIYKTIKNIQSDINNYAVYDNVNCSMKDTITELDSPNNTTQEYITAAKNGKPTINGREYHNIIIDCINKLK